MESRSNSRTCPHLGFATRDGCSNTGDYETYIDETDAQDIRPVHESDSSRYVKCILLAIYDQDYVCMHCAS